MKKILLCIVVITLLNTAIKAQSILGIDVSNHQGNINWSQVATDGKVFAFVKATEGMTFQDARFLTNINEGANAGVIMGAYHFARPDHNTPQQDAINFLNTAQPYIGSGYLPPVIDVEDPNQNTSLASLFTSSQLTSWVQEWITIVENQTGVTPIIYTNGFYAGYLNSSLNNYGLWIANPSTTPNTPPANIGNWNHWLFKQYSWVGSVSGISGDVDLNVFNGSVSDFNTLIGENNIIPTNDNCNNAIFLLSNENCISTSGSVNNATHDDGFADPSCDLFSDPLAAGVFYEFIATHNEHTITVDPSGDLDTVLVLYEGSNCNNLNEIACEDTPGGGGETTSIIANNLTIGTTYWIRVYDFGNFPPSNGDFEICITNPVIGNEDEDITVSNASVNPDSILPGENIEVSADQNYSGNRPNSEVPNVNLGFFLSNDCNLSNDDLMLGNNSSTIGTDDTSDTESNEFTIPEDVQPGNYFILFVADVFDELDEFNENNNILCVEITIGNENQPEDITISNASVNPDSILPGENIEVSADQNYSGNRPNSEVPNVNIGFFLSNDCNLSNDDLVLGDNSSTIGADDTSDTESNEFTIPEDVQPGNYFILFVADVFDELDESNENNNIVCIEITIESDQEDITVENAQIFSSSTVIAGEEIDAGGIHTYSGTSNNIPTLEFHYYLSTNCNFDNTDILLGIDDSTIDTNMPEELETAILTIPINTPTGDYFILFLGDATNLVDESNENNNFDCAVITVEGIQGDITVSNTSVTPNTTIPGGFIEVSADQNYSGNQTTNDLPLINLGYVLSTDCNFDDSDIILGESSSNIGSNNTSDTVNAGVTIPDNVAPGNYFILFIGDFQNELDESNETNNIICEEIIIEPIVEDITVINTIVDPLTVSSGETISFLATQNYSGNRPHALVPDIALGYYLSDDCTLSDDDYFFGEDLSTTLGENIPNETENAAYIIPEGIEAGTYYILFVADNQNVINESNEGNNIDCFTITTLSIEENLLKTSISLYPNPTKGLIYIEDAKNRIFDITVYDLSGRLIEEQESTNTIDLSKASKGIYIVEIENEGKKTIRKVIKN